jgi:NAD(P)-dependent dehydrogenase (short-subunit alcohol dehydrogenase family)
MQQISNYSATEGGVYGLTRALAIEGRQHGILVNALLPSAAMTIAAKEPVPGYNERLPQPLRELLQPRRTTESVAPMLAFLPSRARELTGETLSASCGRYAVPFDLFDDYAAIGAKLDAAARSPSPS